MQGWRLAAAGVCLAVVAGCSTADSGAKRYAVKGCEAFLGDDAPLTIPPDAIRFFELAAQRDRQRFASFVAAAVAVQGRDGRPGSDARRRLTDLCRPLRPFEGK